jgi:energy-coupling factor transport system permease protein
MKQPWAWVIWLVGVLVMLTITRNPLYLVLIIMCVAFVGLGLRDIGASIPQPFSMWKFAGWIILLATAFNALTSHFGDTVLFTIPGNIPLISGNLTLEAMVYGATNGLILTGMLAGFTVLNLALPIRDLISLIPRAFFPVAVATSIAVTYLPTTLRQIQQIREAQEVRGHQMRSLRDWLPLLMPLLVGGLEHAMQLAEAMTARGFASSKPATSRQAIYPRLLMLIGVLLLAAGWVVQLGTTGWSGWVLIVLGIVLVISGLWSLGRQSRRTVYHRPGWSWQDGLVIFGMVLMIAAGTLPIPGMGRETLYYEPYPVLKLPGFSLWMGISLLALLIPGLVVISNGVKEKRLPEVEKAGG